MDGITLLIGCKIAGIKVLLPVTGVEKQTNFVYDPNEPKNALLYPIYFACGYLGISYLILKY